MEYHTMKEKFDKFVEREHPECTEHHDNTNIHDCLKLYGKNFKTYMFFPNLIRYKKILDDEAKQFLINNPYVHDWMDEKYNVVKNPGKEEVKVKKEKEADRKIYKCTLDNCNRQYKSAFGLKYHMKEGHSKKKLSIYKPYVCNVEDCGRKYKNNNGLQYHLRTFHKIE